MEKVPDDILIIEGQERRYDALAVCDAALLLLAQPSAASTESQLEEMPAELREQVVELRERLLPNQESGYRESVALSSDEVTVLKQAVRYAQLNFEIAFAVYRFIKTRLDLPSGVDPEVIIGGLDRHHPGYGEILATGLRGGPCIKELQPVLESYKESNG